MAPSNRPGRWRWVVAGLLTLVVVAAFATAIGYLVELQPARPGSHQSIGYQLKPGTSVPVLARQLQDAGVIRNATVFTWYVTVTGLRSQLEAGSYELSPASSTPTIAGVIAHGKVTHDLLVVPEGTDSFTIERLMMAQGIGTPALNAALSARYTNPYLVQRPVGDSSLEGYLFPDSYQITKPANAEDLIQAMLSAFSTKIGSTDIAAGFAAQGLTFNQGLTLASIVQKEAGKPADQPMIAGVFFNRLKADMALGSDVTVNYASELTGLPFSTALDSPYNTYLHKGLPPSPICSPGLSAMEAVAHPAPSDYLYFLADKQGTIHYAVTGAQHQANIKQYLQ